MNHSSNVVIGGSTLTEIAEIKYLGMIINNKITRMPHITYVKNKASNGIGIMFKAKKIIKKNTLINLYHSYNIYPYLIYCIEAWGNASNCHLEQLYLTQKNVARIILFSNYNAHSICIFKQLNILPLNKLVINRIGIMMYKYVNNLLPPVINDMYTTIVMYIITLQDRSTYYMSIRVILISTQKALLTQVLAYVMPCSPKLR